jgi:hypothetical protein
MSESEWVCPACDLIPVDEAERTRHEAGVDEKHLACAHQDIDAIKAKHADPRGSFFGKAWG